MVDLQWLDKKAIDAGFFPIGISLGLIVIMIGLFYDKIWGYFRRYPQNKKRFEDEFDEERQQIARQKCRWHLARAYFTHSTQRLWPILDDFAFPEDFPANREKCLQRDNWQDENGQRLWDFCNALLKEVVITGKSEMMPETFDEFLAARRVASKFWDDWSRAIIFGRLRYEDVKKMFDSNRLDIQAIVICELAIHNNVGWDRGPGKQSLFWVAANINDLGNKEWRKSARAALEGRA